MSGEGLTLDGRSWKFLQYPEAYCEASQRTDRPLVPEPTRRQFATAAEILARLSGAGTQQVGGVLLADDVGLGKTTVAALVAWVVAGTEGTVRILAPNAVLRRRWEEELKAHVPLLQKQAPSLMVHANQIKGWETERLRGGRIQVGTHHQLVSAWRDGLLRTGCSLLIVDEAHRAKGEESAFHEALVEQGGRATAKLILTATPFSIAEEELVQLLGFCGAQGIASPVKRYAQALRQLHAAPQGRDPEHTARRLLSTARDAMDALAPYVIRHGINDLTPTERRYFGEVGGPWNIEVPAADDRSLELLLRTDRLLRLTRERRGERTNDPRFHVGWGHLLEEVDRVEELAEGPVEDVVKRQHARTRRLLRRCTQEPHPKMAAVASAIAERVEAQEKVLIFCHHRATALELLQVLNARLRLPKDEPSPLSEEEWREEWRDLLQERTRDRPLVDEHNDAEALLDTYLDWLCGPGLCRQVLSWLPERPRSGKRLRELLARTRVRGRTELRVPFVADAADALFRNLTDARSRSTLGLLRAARSGESRLPGSREGGQRVLGAWKHAAEGEQELPSILFQGEPDVVLSIFNSPFGPDVLVATDRLSEGVDLHRCCRLLVHYELDPSPIRTLQRNGRVRRVGGWASLTNQSIEYAYPSFNGTRDARAVQVMNMRLQRFDLLLGGVPPVSLDEDAAPEDSFVHQVLAECGNLLKAQNRRLRL